MASVTHQALFMIGGTGTAAATPRGWASALSTVPPSALRIHRQPFWADAAWLSPISQLFAAPPPIGWARPLSVAARVSNTGNVVHPWAGWLGAEPPYSSFVTNGTIAQSTSVHTGSLPSSRVNGNLLIFYFKVRNTSNDPTVSAGWTLIDNIFGGATYRYGAYYCYIDGAEAAPTLTWAGGGQAVSEIMQYSSVRSSSPTVAGTKASSQTGTTISTTAITSTASKSIAISASWDDAAVAPSLPSGFTNEGVGVFQNVFGSLRLCEVQIAASGASSGAVSCTQGGSVPWGTLLFELKSH